jgi:oxygen-independent coproporphyrinogen-3 oxidase
MYIKDLNNIISLDPEHISSYSLIIEEGTRFYDNPEILDHLPSEDDAVRMYELTNEYLKNAGYNRYEISNYAKLGYESRHNSSYWKLVDYIGVGLGASSYFGGVRYKVHQDFKAYINGDYHHEEVEEISNKDSMEEFMFLGLRMMEGVKLSDFKMRYGVDIESVYGEVIEKHINLGNLIKTQSHIKLSAEAIPISNQVFVDFML